MSFCWHLLIWAPFSLRMKESFYDGALVRKECFLKTTFCSLLQLIWRLSHRLPLNGTIFMKPESAALSSLARLASINTAVWNDQMICHEPPLFKGLPRLVSLHYLTIHVLSTINHQAWTVVLNLSCFNKRCCLRIHSFNVPFMFYTLNPYVSVFTCVCSRLGVFV